MTNPTLLDVETMFDSLVTDAMPSGVTAIQDLHANSFDEHPYVAWKVANNGQVDHAFWSVTLILNVVSEPDVMFAVCSGVYSAVTEWGIPGEGVVADVGAVHTVTDGAVFDKTFEGQVHGKYLSQSTATFSISIEQF